MSLLLPLDPSSPPQGLRADAINTTAVMLSWSPPQDSGGIDIVLYAVYYQALISGSLRMTWGNFYTTSVTVTNLHPATGYRMTVVAQNGGSWDEENGTASIDVTTLRELPCKSCQDMVGHMFSFPLHYIELMIVH